MLSWPRANIKSTSRMNECSEKHYCDLLLEEVVLWSKLHCSTVKIECHIWKCGVQTGQIPHSKWKVKISPNNPLSIHQTHFFYALIQNQKLLQGKSVNIAKLLRNFGDPSKDDHTSVETTHITISLSWPLSLSLSLSLNISGAKGSQKQSQRKKD